MKVGIAPSRVKAAFLGTLAMALVAQGPSEDPDRARSLQELKALMATPVKVATGTAMPWSEAPASVTVITGADIEAMGADSLDDALAMVPGLHVSASGALGTNRYLFRGVVSTFNPQVLLLVDGVPQTSVVRGDRSGVVGRRIPASAIAWIEVIRGPGSAVYGEEAFAGIVHVHTRVAAGLEGTQGGLALGSYRSREAWAGHGGALGGFQLGLTASGYQTDGPRRVLEADAQTGFDQLAPLLPAASRAPGAMDLQGRYGDVNLDLGRGDWHFRAGQEVRLDLGMGQGGANALDPDGRIASHRTQASLSYARTGMGSGWDLEVLASYRRITQEVQHLFHLLPAGAFFGAFPDGFIGNPGWIEASRRLEGTAVYSGWANHRVRVGLGVDRGEMVRVTETKNFDSAFNPLPGGLTDVSGTDLDWLPLKHRTSHHAFAQDEWSFRGWTLTTGLRFDRFSDVGSSTNPRIALVGEVAPGWMLKLLHGQAFRAPAFVELWGRNNPVAFGNPDLRPERLSTTEAVLGWKATEDLLVELNLFHTNIRDAITFLPDPGGTRTAQNSDRLRGQGGELSLTYAPSTRFRITANASYQDMRDEVTDLPLGEAPRARAYLRLDRRFLTYWQADLQGTWVGTRPRAAVDPRGDLKGYTTLDAVLRRERLFGQVDLRLVVRNLLDRQGREPSAAPNAGAPFVDIPYDYPLAGRSVMVELLVRGR
ncbi:MAG TPA: TonB-dependent receptor [Holophagaceae bacterium]|nr:TonB-dependent receptor [Holophagaceae bacterium]